MSMIDEETLSEALREVANSFDISKEATERILNDAREAEPEPRLLRTPEYIRRQSRGLKLLSAAALVIAVGAISLPLMRDEATPVKSATGAHKIVVHGLAPLGTPTSSQSGLALSGTGLSISASGTKSVSQGSAAPRGAASLSTKIESTGSVNLTVNKGHVDTSLSKLSSLATADGGFVLSTQANATSRGSGNFSSGTIVLQVPQRTFAQLVTQVQQVGHATSILTSSSDVTSQYVDLQARIHSLEASRQQYLTIMTRATTIGGILAVQSQLDNLQSQIEQYQGQLNVLSHETTFATLTVMLAQKGQPIPVTHHRSGLAKAWHDAVNGFVAGIEWLVRLSGPALFAVLLLSVLLAAGKLVWRALRRRRI